MWRHVLFAWPNGDELLRHVGLTPAESKPAAAAPPQVEPGRSVKPEPPLTTKGPPPPVETTEPEGEEFPWEAPLPEDQKPSPDSSLEPTETKEDWESIEGPKEGMAEILEELKLIREQRTAESELVAELKAERTRLQARDVSLGKKIRELELELRQFKTRLQPGVTATSGGGSTFSWQAVPGVEKAKLLKVILAEIKKEDDRFVLREEWADTCMRATDKEVRISKRVADVERELQHPEGVIHHILDELSTIEARRSTHAIEMGGVIFRDITALDAMIAASGQDLSLYCVDMISVLTLASDKFTQVDEGLVNYAAAFKAQFRDYDDGRLCLSFDITYPEYVAQRSKSTEAQLNGGWTWSAAFKTADTVMGSFHNGTQTQLKEYLDRHNTLMTATINSQFPVESHPKINAVLLDQLRRTILYTTGWLESLIPFYRTLLGGGLTEKDSWERVFVYTKNLLDNVRRVRVTATKMTPTTRMWGSMSSSILLEEYAEHRFVEHPKVSSILALTAMEREGHSVSDAVAALKGDRGTIIKHESRLKKLETDLKEMKERNPSLH